MGNSVSRPIYLLKLLKVLTYLRSLGFRSLPSTSNLGLASALRHELSHPTTLSTAKSENKGAAGRAELKRKQDEEPEDPQSPKRPCFGSLHSHTPDLQKKGRTGLKRKWDDEHGEDLSFKRHCLITPPSTLVALPSTPSVLDLATPSRTPSILDLTTLLDLTTPLYAPITLPGASSVLDLATPSRAPSALDLTPHPLITLPDASSVLGLTTPLYAPITLPGASSVLDLTTSPRVPSALDPTTAPYVASVLCLAAPSQVPPAPDVTFSKVKRGAGDQLIVPSKRLRRAPSLGSPSTGADRVLESNHALSSHPLCSPLAPFKSFSTSILVLPTELFHQIFSFFGEGDLRVCSQVSVFFREVAGPLFLNTVRFKPGRSPYWLSLDTTQYLGLLVWARLGSFAAPKDLFCSITENSHLRALDIFLQTPRTVGKVSVFLTCSGDSLSMTALATTLWNTGLAHCRRVFFSHTAPTPSRPPRVRFPKIISAGQKHLDVFSVDTHLAFCPELMPFTMTVLLHSPLKVLSIRNVGFSGATWGKFLSSLTFSFLEDLRLDARCPLKALLTFLERHPSINTLNISSREDAKGTFARYPLVDLPSLRHLGGPAEYVRVLAKHLLSPLTVRTLAVTLAESRSRRPLISTLLDCTHYFPKLSSVEITLSLSEEMEVVESTRFPSSENRICNANKIELERHVAILAGSHVNPVPRCGSWLRAFPKLQTVNLIPDVFDDPELLRAQFMSFAPYQEGIRFEVSPF